MALMNCPECGHEISDTAKVCTNCGYKTKQCKLLNKKLVGITVLVSILIFISCFAVFQKGKMDRERELTLNAIAQAKEDVRTLSALSSAYIELGEAVEAGTGSKPDFLALQYKILDHLRLGHDMVDLDGINDDILQAIENKLAIYQSIIERE